MAMRRCKKMADGSEVRWQDGSDEKNSFLIYIHPTF
jgi:hypothetical protein